MDSETKEILKQQLELLKKINRHFTYQRVFGTIKNLIVLGFIIFGAIQLQPYLNQLFDVFSQIQGIQEQGIDLPGFLK